MDGRYTQAQKCDDEKLGARRNPRLYLKNSILSAALAALATGALSPPAAYAEAMATLSVERPAPAASSNAPQAATPVQPAPPVAPPSTALSPATNLLAPVSSPTNDASAQIPVASPSALAPVTPPAPAAGPSKTIPPTLDPSAATAPPAPLPAIESMPIRPPSSSNATVTSAPPTEHPATKTGLWAQISSTVQVLGALGAVLGIIFLGKTLLKKMLPGAVVGNGKGVLEVLARYPMSKNQSIVLLRIGSQIVVLNQAKETSQSLLVINEPTEVANILGQIQGAKPNSIQAGFSNLLATAQGELERSPQTEQGDPGDEELPAANRPMAVSQDLDSELDEMAAARRQLMQLRDQVRSARERLT